MEMHFLIFIADSYPQNAPQLILRSDGLPTNKREELRNLLNEKSVELVGKPMLNALVTYAQKWLEDVEVPLTSAPPEKAKSPRMKTKGRKRSGRKKTEDAPVNEKLPSLKTAEDVISRIHWDTKLDKELFTVGYLDRFLGVVEKGFIELSWEDIASVDYNTLAIPKHRIQYFKYRDVKVWDKNERLDHVFGSNGSGRTIYDVIDEDEQHREEIENGTAFGAHGSQDVACDDNDSDESDDDICVVINTGASEDAKEEEEVELTPREKYWGKKDRPTHFLALRITNPAIHAAVSEVHRDILDMIPGYAESLIPCERLHITLCCLGLDTDDQIHYAARKLKEMKEKLVAFEPEKIEVKLEDVDHFYHNCLYAKVRPNPKLMEFANFVRKEVKDIGIECRDVFDFVPHMTILKLMRQKFRENHTRYFDSRIYTSYSGEKFGSQFVDNIHLCSMSDGREEDGFYKYASVINFP